MKIQYPIEVTNIKLNPLYHNSNKPDGLFGVKCGALVGVRPCGDEYGNETYLGIMLGDLPLSVFATYNRENKELEINGHNNPAIFVPELKQIIWGCGSYWYEIKNEEDLRQITDKDIENIWYIKVLKAMSKSQDEKLQPSCPKCGTQTVAFVEPVMYRCPNTDCQWSGHKPEDK